MTLGEIIKKYRKEHGLSMDAFSKRSGISKSYISILEKNQHPKTGKPITPSVDSIKQAAIGMNMNFDELFSIIDSDITVKPKLKNVNSNVPKNESKASRIPVLGIVPCGIPVEAVQEVLDWEEVKEAENYDGKLFALRAKGDSMAPRISEGDILIVHQQPDAESNELIIALVNGDEATCKELKKREDGLVLVPWNTIGHEPQFYSWKDVEQFPVRIIGKVIEIRSKPFRG